MGRIRLPRARWLLAWAVLAGLVVAGLINGQEAATGDREWLPVIRVVDGDTIIVSDGGDELRIRMIGVDTPETVHPTRPVQCYGRQASQFVTELLDGERVRLEHDPSQDQVDQYGRELAYVWLDDETMVNELIIAEGYGHEYTYREPYRYRERLRTAQDDAEHGDVGLWSPRTCDGDTDRPAER